MLIGVTGAKGSGKDTFAEVFVRRDWANLKMAAPLKAMLRQMYRMAGYDHAMIDEKIEGHLKEVPCEILGGQTPRHAMQTLGTEWRDMIDRELWSRIWRIRVERALFEGDHVICTDVRFKHEAQVIRDLGGFLIRIERPSLETGDHHISETEMLSLRTDCTILNIGSVHALQMKAEKLLGDLQNGTFTPSHLSVVA